MPASAGRRVYASNGFLPTLERGDYGFGRYTPLESFGERWWGWQPSRDNPIPLGPAALIEHRDGTISVAGLLTRGAWQ